MTPRWDVVGVGENSVDFVYLVQSLPRPGGKARILDRQILYGGQAATTVCTCASLGLRAKYVGTVGADESGRHLRGELTRHGVDVADLVERDAENRYAVILVDQATGERVVLWQRSDRLNLRDAELPLDAFASARVVHVDQTDEAAALRAASTGQAAGALVTTDIDHVVPVTPQLMGLATHAILAEDIPSQMTGIADLERALRQLRTTTEATLVVTLGKRGSVALEGDRFQSAVAFGVRAVDTTGAGDVFRGGLIYALLRNEPVVRALRFANAAAAVSCTRVGAMNGVPTVDDINGLMKE